MFWGSIQMHTKANDIIEVAKGLVGVRYRKQGRNSVGLDCLGLVIVVAHLNEISDFDTTAYSSRPNVKEFTEGLLKTGCIQIPYSEIAHGDMFRISMGGWPVHIALYEVDEQQQEWYIHASLDLKQVVRTPLTKEVKASISSVWRYPEKN